MIEEKQITTYHIRTKSEYDDFIEFLKSKGVTLRSCAVTAAHYSLKNVGEEIESLGGLVKHLELGGRYMEGGADIVPKAQQLVDYIKEFNQASRLQNPPNSQPTQTP